MSQLYDAIGVGYREHRRPDPRIARAITRALGDADSVVNVGAGAGSYEPADRRVVAVEPSPTMIRQRRAASGPGFWLVDDYFPELVEIDRVIFPPLDELARALGAIVWMGSWARTGAGPRRIWTRASGARSPR